MHAPWSQAFFPSDQCPALHHINPQLPLTNTLHGHDLDFMSVLTFDLDFALVWLWLSSNSPTLFFVNYLFLLQRVCIPFFSILREWNHLTPLSMKHQISHLCSYSVLNATNPRSCCQAICILISCSDSEAPVSVSVSSSCLCLDHRLFPPPINVLPSTISTPNHLSQTLFMDMT